MCTREPPCLVIVSPTQTVAVLQGLEAGREPVSRQLPAESKLLSDCSSYGHNPAVAETLRGEG